MATLAAVDRPGADETAPYYRQYIERVAADDVTLALEQQGERTRRLLAGLDEARADHRYAPQKWSVKEVVGHVIDAERVFGFRAFAFARGDGSPLPSMDQDVYAASAGYQKRRLADIADELVCVRRATLALFRSLDSEAAARSGIASGVSFSVRSLAWIIAGHELHHAAVLRERYGLS